MNTTTTYLSKKGMKELKRSVQQLERRLKAANQALHEIEGGVNREDRLTRVEKLAVVEALDNELYEKRIQLKDARLFPRKRDALKAGLGSVVYLADQQGRLFCYTLVNSIEANPSDGRISILSPLGQSLIGKTVHDTIEWTSHRLQPQSLKLVNVT